MRELRLVAVNQTGTHLVLRAPDGEELAVSVDERLEAAVRRDRARLGQLEIQLESSLRPRDIQARIRSGASAEEVAHDAGVPLERIRRFEGPVLREREHIADAARGTAVRRQGEGGPVPALGEVVSARLEARGVAPESMRWDSWRRDDGSWTIRVSYRAGSRDKAGQWAFDPRRRVVTPDDDEARWLTGDEPEPRREPARPFVPKLAPVADDAEPVADDPEPVAQPRTERLTGTTDRQAVADGVRPGGRATVPSWDDIVFGSRKHS